MRGGTSGTQRGSSRLRVHFLSSTTEWATPQWLFDILDSEFGFSLDPCATAANAKCGRYFTAADDGLKQDWATHTVFMNPPYGRAISQWMEKAYHSSDKGATVVCLVPARTDTKWWHEYALKGEVRFICGRIKFQGARHSAPFPSAVVVFRAKARQSLGAGVDGVPVGDVHIWHTRGAAGESLSAGVQSSALTDQPPTGALRDSD